MALAPGDAASLNGRVYLWPSIGLDRPPSFTLFVSDDGGGRSVRCLPVDDLVRAIAGLPGELRLSADAQLRAHLAGRRRPPLLAAGGDAGLTAIMGILNVTPDSFSDGGVFNGADAALAHARGMRAAGAAIVDIGGESTRPGADAVPLDEELRRVIPIVERIAADGAIVSIDTRRPEVMAAALAAGARMVNDVSALRHGRRGFAILADAGCFVVLMHAPGAADDLHAGPGYRDIALDVFDFLAARRDAAIAHGIAADRIILDPGIGFGKSPAQNVAVLRALPLLRGLGCPLLIGASRKRMIAAIAGEAPPDRRIGGSLALALAAIDGGADILRVHDVAETAQAMAVWAALRHAPSETPA